MIILDTNVVSEPFRPSPDAGLVAWLDAQTIETLFLTTVTVAEMRFGIAVLPRGRRQRELESRFEHDVLPLFADRLLTFDEPASAAYARLRAKARREGTAISTTDAYIAAIAAAHDFMVATRDTSGFKAAGVGVINPFDPGAS
jgi:predicted nucleic acid-binding protein